MIFKRALACLLILVMALSVFSFSAFASEQEAEKVMLLASFNNFEGVAMEHTEGAEYAVTLELEEGSYSFKIKHNETLYGHPGTVKDTTVAVSDKGFVMSDEVGAYCTMLAIGGSYTFSFNTETYRLKVTDGSETASKESKSLTINYGGGVTIANVGDIVSYSVYLTSNEALEDLQAALNYNSDKLSLVKVSEEVKSNYPNLTEAVFNGDLPGVATLNGTDYNGCDFTEEKLLLTLDFEVTGTGSTSLEFIPQEMTSLSGGAYYNFSQKISDGALLRETLTVTKEANPARFTGCTITLTGQIAVNFHMSISDTLASDETAKVEFTMPNGVKRSVLLKDAEKKGENYVFACQVAAKEMASKIKARFIASEYQGEVFEYSVKEYAEYIIDKAVNPENGTLENEYAKAAPLAKAMLNYGAAAQNLFGFNTKNLANDSLSNGEKEVLEAELSKYMYSLTGEESGVSYYGSRLSLESETSVKHYFYIEDEQNIPEITVNDKIAEANKVNGYYEIKIPDILAQNLCQKTVVTIGGITLDYNAMSYGYLAQQTDNQNLKNVINALFAYSQAAKAYLNLV